jgi:6-phosphogluconolactonase
VTSFKGEIREVDDVAVAFADLVAQRKPPSIALSGGSTAEEAYAALATRGLDWSDTEVFIGDERFVPVDDPDSNEGMIRRVLFSTAQPKALRSMAGAGATVEAAAEGYDALVRASDPIELVHLGLGPDGHTASLVPGDPVLEVDDRRVALTETAYQGHRRMTLTYPAIDAARQILWLVTGAEKREPLAKLLAGDGSIPAGRVANENMIVVADEAAAG